MVAFIKGLSSVYNSPISSPTFVSPQPQQVNSNFLDYAVTSPHGHRYNFRFEYKKVGSVWRAYIVNSPSYGSRSSSAGTVHRLNDGRDYVCWKPEPTRLDDITQVSKNWAKATANYIDTGVFS